MKIGRPTKYKPEYCQMLIKHMSEGLSFKTFGVEINVDEDTLFEWCNKHKEFSESKRIGRRAQESFYEKFGRSAMAGKIKNFNATAFVWMTKNMIGWRDKHDIELSGKEGAEPIQIQTSQESKNLTDAELKERLRQILQPNQGNP